MKNFTMTSLFISVVFLISSCAKDGETGPAGAPGTNGTNGNANVHTQTFTISSWTYTAPSYRADIWDTDITQSIADNGFVMVYLSNGSGGWQALPYSTITSASFFSTWNFVYYLNGVTLYKTDSDLTQPSNPGTRTYKVVAASEAGRIANPNVDWTNYEQVKKTFNLNN